MITWIAADGLPLVCAWADDPGSGSHHRIESIVQGPTAEHWPVLCEPRWRGVVRGVASARRAKHSELLAIASCPGVGWESFGQVLASWAPALARWMKSRKPRKARNWLRFGAEYAPTIASEILKLIEVVCSFVKRTNNFQIRQKQVLNKFTCHQATCFLCYHFVTSQRLL